MRRGSRVLALTYQATHITEQLLLGITRFKWQVTNIDLTSYSPLTFWGLTADMTVNAPYYGHKNWGSTLDVII